MTAAATCIERLETQPAMAALWDQYVLQHPRASIYHLSAWQSLLHKCFGHETYYYCVQTQGAVQGILPLVRLRSRLFGDYMVSMPFFNYGGSLGVDGAVEEQLMRHAANEAAALGCSHIEFRDTQTRPGYVVKTEKVAMLLELPAEEDVLWKALGPKRRAQIKRPLRENPVLREGDIQLLDDFYHVFAHNMRDLGTPVYAKKFFRSILQAFPERTRLIVLRLNKQPVAAAFLLGFRDTLEIPWASTLRKANPSGMNMLLYWEVLKYAIRSGYKIFDFGRSTRDSGTYRFKQQWGAQAQPFYWHYWLSAEQTLPELNPHNPKYRLAIGLWQKMPVALTRLIGPSLVKNLP